MVTIKLKRCLVRRGFCQGRITPAEGNAVASRSMATTYGGARRRMRVLLMLLVVLAVGGQVSCGSATDTSADGDCGQAPTTSEPRGPRTGPTGAAGSASVPRHSAPPPAGRPPPPPLPTPVNGRVALTAANTGQAIVVPAGTVIEVRLEPISGSVWTLPESSDPQALSRLAASGFCDTVKAATFRAVGGGEIIATRPHGSAEARLVVTIRITG